MVIGSGAPARSTGSYYSPREGLPDDLHDEDRTFLSAVDDDGIPTDHISSALTSEPVPDLLSTLVALKVLGRYQEELKEEYIRTEAHCIAADTCALKDEPKKEWTSSDHSPSMLLLDDSCWHDWRERCANGTAIDGAAERVAVDPKVASVVLEWLATETEQYVESVLIDGGPPQTSDIPTEGMHRDDHINAMSEDRSSSPLIRILEAPNSTYEAGAHDTTHYLNGPSLLHKPTASPSPPRPNVSVNTTEMHDDPDPQPKIEHPIASQAPSGLRLPIEHHRSIAMTPMARRPSTQTACGGQSRSGRIERMHRSLKNIAPKKFEENMILSDDEGNKFRDFLDAHNPPPKHLRHVKTPWAQDKRAWENIVKKQSKIDAHSIFGWGAAPIEFVEVFKSPDFRRAATDMARNQDPKCRNILSQECRADLERKWHEEGVRESAVTADQVRKYREQYASKKRCVSSLVWEQTWTACEEGCSHNSALRQPWFKQGSSSRGLSSPCHRNVGASLDRQTDTRHSPHAESVRSPTVAHGRSVGEAVDKVHWLTQVQERNYSDGSRQVPPKLSQSSQSVTGCATKQSGGGSQVPSSNPTTATTTSGTGGSRRTGGLLKGITGTFHMSTLRENKST